MNFSPLKNNFLSINNFFNHLAATRTCMAGTVWVGSLPSSYSEAQLVSAFSKYGNVTSCVIHGGDYALVQFAKAREALSAAGGVKIDGARIQMYCYGAKTTSGPRTLAEANARSDIRWERYTDCYYFIQEQRCARPAGKVRRQKESVVVYMQGVHVV